MDPLRAERVACFGERFYYFCSAECRLRYSPAARLPPPRRTRASPVTPFIAETPAPEGPGARRDAAEALAQVAGDAVDLLSYRGVHAPEEPSAASIADLGEPALPKLVQEVTRPTDLGTLLLSIAIVGAALAILLFLAGEGSAALTARVLLATAACGSLVAHAMTPGRDDAEPHPAVLVFGPLVATAAAIAGRFVGSAETPGAVTLAALVTGGVAGSIWLVEWARTPIDAERDHIAERLKEPGHRVVGNDVLEASADDLRPGEEIVVEEGETLPVDATIVAGSAKVRPWLGAPSTVERGEGQSLVAGAVVVSGRVRAVVSWAHNDRAWMRLTHDPRRRADVHAPLSRFGRHLAERGSFVGALIAGLAAFSSNRDGVVIAQFAAAAHAALANGPVALMAALWTARGVLTALRRGIVFRTADAFDRTARVSAAAFCARGTLLLGEPEVANIEAFGSTSPETVLSVLAGAEAGAAHPTSIAILRAARARGVRPDGVRSPTLLPGLGVTAVASSGQPVVVGSRALMLRERISVAAAEARITDLEAMGRSVILVALGGKLIGVVGLQDGLRPGARAAVQHLLDVGVEPVLLSGDARETCEALGRAVDIEHIRPEVLPPDRGDEIRRLADGGAVVAVLGRSPSDDIALGAADVSVALSAAGASSAEWHVLLSSDDVKDAAYAIRIAHRTRREILLSLALCISPGAGAAVMMAIGLIPPPVVPLAMLAGGYAAVFRLRSRG